MDSEKLVTLDNPHSSLSELYRRIRTSIEYASIDRVIKVFNVTSVNADEAKTTTASNLAVMFAHKFNRVLLIDTDLRKPSVHRMFKLKNTRGLTDMVLDFAKHECILDAISKEKYIQKLSNEGFINPLEVLCAGSKINNPAEFIGSQTFRILLNKLSEQYDIIIVDSAPSGLLVDGIISSTLCQGTVFVMEYNRTTIESAKRVIEQLKSDGVYILGGLLVKTPVARRLFRNYDYKKYYYKSEVDSNE